MTTSAPRAAQRPAGPAPTRAALHDAALAHLARFSTTETGLVRVLDRRIERWARRAAAEGVETQALVPAARGEARAVARALAASGIVNDAAFAAARAARLARAGRSRRAVSAHLAAKGVPAEIAEAALPSPADELAQAVAYARRRRFGPFRMEPADPERARRELAALARAGFPAGVAMRALRLAPAEALALLGRA